MDIYIYIYISEQWIYSSSHLTSALDARMGRDSSVGIATCYGLEGPGIASQWGRDFQHLSRPALELTKTYVQCILGLSRGVNVAGAWRRPPTPI